MHIDVCVIDICARIAVSWILVDPRPSIFEMCNSMRHTDTDIPQAAKHTHGALHTSLYIIYIAHYASML